MFLVLLYDRLNEVDIYSCSLVFKNRYKAEFFAKRYSYLHKCFVRIHIIGSEMFYKSYRDGEFLAHGEG